MLCMLCTAAVQRWLVLTSQLEHTRTQHCEIEPIVISMFAWWSRVYRLSLM